MITRAALLFLTALALAPGLGLAQSTSPNGVRTLDLPAPSRPKERGASA